MSADSFVSFFVINPSGTGFLWGRSFPSENGWLRNKKSQGRGGGLGLGRLWSFEGTDF